MSTAGAAGRAWRTSADVRAAVRRRWADGSLLRAYGQGEQFGRIAVPLRGPKASEIGERMKQVEAWIADLRAGSRDGDHYLIEDKAIGGRSFGRNRIPAHAVISEYEQAWRLLGVGAEVRSFDDLLAASPDGPVREWAIAKPLKALAHASEWPQIVAAYHWLEDARGSGRYLRQIDAPGVDTKFVEARRGVLGELLGVPAGSAAFLRGLGLRATPEYVRLRAARSIRPLPVSELSLRAEDLPDLDMPVRTAVVVENEITYLTVPVPTDGVVIWGKGYDVARLGRWPALRDAEIHYWGDLDTHGFAILHRLRTHLPQAWSFLMDGETLRAHAGRWGQEASSINAGLGQLSAEEAALYDDLVSDRYGERVRLEQERIDWAWAAARLPYTPEETRE